MPLEEAKWNGWVYLVPSSNSKENNVHDEYICVNKGTKEAPQWAWEQIGTTAITIPDPPAAGNHLELANGSYNVKTVETVTENSNNIPTSDAVYKLF